MAGAGELTGGAAVGGLAPSLPWLGAALGGSLLLHVVLLGASALASGEPGTASRGQVGPVVQLVAVAPPAPPVEAPPPPAAPLPDPAPAAEIPEPPAPAAEVPVPPVVPAVEVPEPPPPPAAIAPVAPAATVSGGDGFDYVPRDRLTVVPAPVEEVVVPFPESMGFEFRAAVRLALFVDETGTVQHVRVERSNVGPAFEEAARNAFLAARFKPGEIEGRAVRSLLRVEVEFESRQRLEASDPAASAPRR